MFEFSFFLQVPGYGRTKLRSFPSCFSQDHGTSRKKKYDLREDFTFIYCYVSFVSYSIQFVPHILYKYYVEILDLIMVRYITPVTSAQIHNVMYSR